MYHCLFPRKNIKTALAKGKLKSTAVYKADSNAKGAIEQFSLSSTQAPVQKVQERAGQKLHKIIQRGGNYGVD